MFDKDFKDFKEKLEKLDENAVTKIYKDGAMEKVFGKSLLVAEENFHTLKNYVENHGSEDDKKLIDKINKWIEQLRNINETKLN